MLARIYLGALVVSLLLASAPAAYGQAQRWVVPPNVIDFTTPAPTVTPWKGPSINPYYVANGVFDSGGNLLFSVVGIAGSVEVFDANGAVIGGILQSITFNHQIAVFAVPGNCDQYYIVYFHSLGFTGVELYYSVLDLAQRKILRTVRLNSYVADSRGALAVSRLHADGSRFLYSIAYPFVQKWIVGSTGITLDPNHPSVLDARGSQVINGLDFSAIQAVLSTDGRKLVWGGDSLAAPPGHQIHVVDLDANGDYAGLTLYPGRAAGLELSPNGIRLFISPPVFPTPGLPLSFINLVTGIRDDVKGSEGYTGTMLQRAADGKIYAAGASDLGAIDPVTLDFTPAAVPRIVTGTLAHSLIGGSRTLPYQIDGEPQLTCETLCGNPALIQSHFGIKGNFEVVTPYPTGGFAHYWRDNDQGPTWHGPYLIATDAGAVAAVSLIQSSSGDLEVVARIGDRLAHFNRSSLGWSQPNFFTPPGVAVSGTPSLIQGSFGNPPGNFEVVTPLAAGGMAHFFGIGQTWYETVELGQSYGPVSDVSLIQGSYGGNLEVVARIGDRLAHFWRGGDGWHDSGFFAAGVSGAPSLIQGSFGIPGNFEVVAPLAAGGIAHYFRDNPAGGIWNGPYPFGSGTVRSAALIQSNYGQNLEVMARVNCSLFHYWRGSGPFTWYGPNTIVP